MADHEYEILMWSDVNGDRHEGVPPEDVFGSYVDLEHVDGVLIKSWEAGDADSVEHHWVYMTHPWEDFDAMYYDIEDSIDMYGQAQ